MNHVRSNHSIHPIKAFGFIALLLTAWLSTPILAGDSGEIIFIDGFEGTGNVPQFVPIDDQGGVAGRLLQVDIDTADPENQAGLSFSLPGAPPGMTIQSTTGLIQWTPSDAQLGISGVTVRVEDLAGLANTTSFDIEVIDPSAAPLITPIDDQVALTETLFELTVIADDSDPGDVVTFSLDTAPPGLVIHSLTGVLSLLPEVADIGVHPVIVRATDLSGQFDIESFELTVVEDNQPPVLAPIADRGGAPGVALTVQPAATDPDDTDLTWSLDARPTGMVIDPDSGSMNWTPGTQQLGPHQVIVRVQDPLGFADSTGFEIFVDLNRPPVAVDDSGFRVERGDTLSVPAPGVLANDEDPNDDPLTTQLVTGPQQGTLTLNADGGFDYTPDNPAGTIDFELKWEHLEGGGSYPHLPLIANLDDDPASEIVIFEINFQDHELIALDGATGEVEWKRIFKQTDLNSETRGAVGDIDLDGKPEILYIGREPGASGNANRMIYAFEHHGGVKWVSEPLPLKYWDTSSDTLRSRGDGEMRRGAISLADLDQDGIPEILVAPGPGSGGINPPRYQVWDAEGRKLDFVEDDEGARIQGSAFTRIEVVDLDLDGDPEIVVGSTAWSHTGELLWRLNNVSSGLPREFPVIANLDDDPYPELIRRRGNYSPTPARGNVVAWNHDGSLLWEIDRDYSGTGHTAPITIADVDNDGLADILLPGTSSEDILEVLNGTDGSVKWSQTAPSGRGGATAFDLDRDGFNEVLFLDQDGTVHVWDGRDGTPRTSFDLPGNTVDNTLIQFADVDADGRAELVTLGGGTFGTTAALQVWESPNDDWGPTRSIWNQQRYYVTNVNDDLTIPSHPLPHWLQPGLNQAMVNERLPEARVEESDFFEYLASDGELLSNTARVDITVLPPNATPRILSTPKLLASPGFEYSYPVLAVDSDPGETLTVAVAEGPPGMAVDAQNIVRWTPDGSDLGQHVVVIDAVDSLGARASQNYVLEVVAPVTVPDLSGLTETQAIAALEAATLEARPILEVFSDTVSAGQVAGQDPTAGATTAAGADVAVEISLGPVPVTVPDVIGLTEGNAVADIESSGLTVGALSFVNDPSMPRGAVLTQDPPPRSQAAPGASVELVISGGPRALIRVEPLVITSGGSAEVFVEVRDIDGTPLDPQPAITLSLAIDPETNFGTPPSLSGSTLQTAADTLGGFELIASYSAPDPELIAEQVVALAPISDGPNGDLHSRFSRQLEQFGDLIEALQAAVDEGDGPAIEALDQALGDLADAIDLRRLRTMVPLTPPAGMLPTADQAITGGLLAGADDAAYVDVSLELVELLDTLADVMREGTAPDVVINQLNQQLAETAATLAALEPSAPGVLEAGGAITAVTGTFAPRLLVADIDAVRQALRDEGIINADGQAVGGARFTVLGLLSATRIRNRIIRDIYVPYIWRVAGMMGAVIAADLLQTYANAGAVSGLITGASQALHVFRVAPSAIEGFGFDPTLSPNNAVTMIGPKLFAKAAGAASALNDATSVEDVNSAMDAVQDVLDSAENLEQAWNDANSLPMGVASGCILDGRPGCGQLIFPDGFTSVYDASGPLDLPGPVLIIVRNLKTSGWAVFVANFVAFEED